MLGFSVYDIDVLILNDHCSLAVQSARIQAAADCQTAVLELKRVLGNTTK